MQNQELEAMIQRYATGDRDPGLLAFLDAAAWECFHDPWETAPAGPGLETDQDRGRIISVLDEIIEPRHLDPTTPLADQLAAFLDAQGWPHTRDETGGLCCVPTWCGMDGRDLTLRLSMESRRNGRLCFYMTSTWTVPESGRREARWFCDKWNHSGRTLDANLDMPPSRPGQPRPPQGRLVLDRQFPLAPQGSARGVPAFLRDCLADAADFWAMARQDAGRWNRTRG